MIRFIIKDTKVKIKIFTPNEMLDHDKKIIIKEMHENLLARHRGFSMN